MRKENGNESMFSGCTGVKCWTHEKANLLQTHRQQLFNQVQGSNKIPMEIAVGSKVSPDSFGLFGTKVLAEVPQSTSERSPASCRSQICVAKSDDNHQLSHEKETPTFHYTGWLIGIHISWFMK